MASGKEQPPPGIRYKDANREVTASEGSITSALGAVERLGNRALDWSQNNPVQFIAVLVCLVIVATLRYLGRIDAERMKHELENKRIEARTYQQQPLPLDVPKQPEGGKHG